MKWLSLQFPTFKRFARNWQDNFTVTGRTVFLLTVVCLPTLPVLDSPLYLLFSALVSVQLVAAVAGRFMRPDLSVQISAPSECFAGRALNVVVTLTNHSIPLGSDISIEWVQLPSSWDADSARRIPQPQKGQSVRVPLSLHPRHRGRFELPPLRVANTFPFGLYRFHQRFRSAGTVIVLPSFQRLARLSLSATVPLDTGAVASGLAVLGSGDDYFSSREYVPGVPVRRWDHSSSARLGRPVVREYTDPQHPSAAIVIDTRVSDASREDPYPEVEAVVCLAAAISEALVEQGYQISWLATVEGVIQLSSQSMSQRHATVMRSLALAAPAPERMSWDCSVENLRLPHGLVFALLPRWDQQNAELCKLVNLGGGVLKRIFLSAGPATGTMSLEGDTLVSLDQIAAGEVEIS